MIEAIDLHKRYGTIAALSGVSFAVQPGEIVGYLGPNGAGKSTTVKILTGLIPPDSGRALVGGFDVAREPLQAKRLLGLVPETGALYEALTPMEYLRFVGALYELPPADAERRAGALLEELRLEASDWHRRMSGFSKGMRQRVVIAAALLHEPRAILFDEPLNGLDVEATIQVKSIIGRRAAAGCAILYCSHLLDVVERVCTRILVLAHGTLRGGGSLDDMRARYPGRSLEDVFRVLTAESSETTPAAGPASD